MNVIGMLIGVAVVATSLAIATRMKQAEIRCERARPGTDVTGKSRELGASIAANTCPVCRENNFYNGAWHDQSLDVYCGNENCRSGFEVTNLGPGEVYAKRIDNGHDSLYSKPARAANNNNKSLLSRVWTRRRKA